MQQLAALKGDVKHYDWGGTQLIPSLLLIENPQSKPFAEYWMGVHPQANCTISLPGGKEVLLREYIASAPLETLGAKVDEMFGNMPYLLKVLDVKDMLSIQVHPSKKQAAIDFEEENKKGVPLNAPNRNYKDANHKPELMVALGDFYLLHGFKPENELLQKLEEIPELQFFVPVFKKEGYFGLYKLSMEMPQEEVNKHLQPLLNRILPLYNTGRLEKSDENFWAARAAITFARPDGVDRGIFSIYFFNLLHLVRGEAIFQNAGVPHAYLEGHNVEIMASSDNVLRGGLTTKHIDTVELLRHTKCEETNPKIIRESKNKSYKVYQTPVNDFELSSYRIAAGETISITPSTAEILLLVEGELELTSSDNHLILKPGSIAAVGFPGDTIRIKGNTNAILFKAGVPV
ncbi:MAG: mannose-6-phosphate isomerase, class I [Niabella sp.]